MQDGILFDGQSLGVDRKGGLSALGKDFEEEDLWVDLSTTQAIELSGEIEKVYRGLVLGIRDYFEVFGMPPAVLGVSGGIDSAVVCVLAKEALGAKRIHCLSLPSPFSSFASFWDADQLCRNLNVSLTSVSIEPLYKIALQILGESLQEKTKENVQPRLRALLLMAKCNEMDAILLNTSNKSEAAMGYTTLYGDLAGGIAPLFDVTKTRVYQLAAYINRHEVVIPQGIIDRPPSAELKEGQVDTDTLPPYEWLDQVITLWLEEGQGVDWMVKEKGWDRACLEKVIETMESFEYKRRQAPLALRVTKKAWTVGRRSPIMKKGWRCR
jgi:NAD+ synthase (glutamine-hydrolysing)